MEESSARKLMLWGASELARHGWRLLQVLVINLGGGIFLVQLADTAEIKHLTGDEVTFGAHKELDDVDHILDVTNTLDGLAGE